MSVPSFNPLFGPPSVIPIPLGHPPPLTLRQTIPLPPRPLRLQTPAQPKKPLAQPVNQPIVAKNVSPNSAERANRKMKPKMVLEPDLTPQNKQHQSALSPTARTELGEEVWRKTKKTSRSCSPLLQAFTCFLVLTKREGLLLLTLQWPRTTWKVTVHFYCVTSSLSA